MRSQMQWGNSPDVVFNHYFKDKTSTLAAKGIAKLAAAMGEHAEHQVNTKMLTKGVPGDATSTEKAG